ncbi:unnamed protein product [Staurois parvus]|uniref:Uncharacterized protein n=1 Tax=Staurois parvus TaxID=386267 RepID=A0ABN9FUE7_9NEOB|nr:unnamed protein product [Staurois parvus]
MQSSKQDVTCDIIAYYVLRVTSVNDHRGHMVRSYSQQPCTM